jgi:hypothetical protein
VDQQTIPLTRKNSLNSAVMCLKVVDTFRLPAIRKDAYASQTGYPAYA